MSQKTLFWERRIPFPFLLTPTATTALCKWGQVESSQCCIILPPFPLLHPREKATENEDLRECEVIKGSRAEGSKPQQPAGRDIPPAAAIPRHMDVHSGSYPHPAPPCRVPQQNPGTPRFQCNISRQCTGLLFAFSCTTPRRK